MPRSGRPKSVTTPRVKNLVRERIRRNPQRTLRKMAAEVHISRGSMQNLVKNELNLGSFKKEDRSFPFSRYYAEEAITKPGSPCLARK